MRRHLRFETRSLVALLTILAVLAAGCGGDADDEATARPSPSSTNGDGDAVDPAAGSPFDEAFSERVDADGTIPTDLALDMFAANYGPIPGADDSSVPTEGLRSGSLPIRILTARAEELTAEQRAAIESALETSTEGQLVEAAAGDEDDASAGHVVPVALRAVPAEARVAIIAARSMLYLNDRLGRPSALPIRIHVVPDSELGAFDGDSMADGTGPLGEADDLHCRVRIAARVATGTESSLESTTAHEVFHCYQMLVARADVPAWIEEGQAEWVGETFAGGSPSSARQWNAWLSRPDISLFRRTYPAIGFYAAIEADGTDPWSVLDDMGQAESSLEALHIAASASDAETALRLGRRATRAPDIGPIWESSGPGIASTRGARRLTVAEGRPANPAGPLPAMSSSAFDVNISTSDATPVLRVHVGGAQLAIGSTGGDDAVVTAAIAFCVGPGECACPGAPEPLPPLDPDRIVMTAATATPVDFELSLELISIDDACTAVPGDVPTLVMSGAASLDLAGGYCMDDGFAYRLDIGFSEGFDALEQPAPHPYAAFTYYVSAARLGTTTDAGSTTYYLDSTTSGTDHTAGSSFSLAPDGLSGTFTLTDGSSGSFTCPRVLSADEVFG
ncbi:MAG: hypothetical protein JJE52_17445 [Acidimicrobiia bacterium]|nr:hypothetical protein [Acidimicrobiia bacterium]